jgi:hypothetical protein
MHKSTTSVLQRASEGGEERSDPDNSIESTFFSQTTVLVAMVEEEIG